MQSVIPHIQPILGGPMVHQKALAQWAVYFGGLPLAEAEVIAETYTVYGMLTRIGNVLPFVQAAKETAWFTSPRWKQSYNPAGLGATNDGAWGEHFRTPAEGVLAQYAHLLTYAVSGDTARTHPLLTALATIDPRYDAVKSKGWLGSASRWIDLNGKWAWPGRDYGQSILQRANVLLGSVVDTSTLVWIDC